MNRTLNKAREGLSSIRLGLDLGRIMRLNDAIEVLQDQHVKGELSDALFPKSAFRWKIWGDARRTLEEGTSEAAKVLEARCAAELGSKIREQLKNAPAVGWEHFTLYGVGERPKYLQLHLMARASSSLGGKDYEHSCLVLTYLNHEGELLRVLQGRVIDRPSDFLS
jgi:hypothetical protein